jgi:hypothetical protein
MAPRPLGNVGCPVGLVVLPPAEPPPPAALPPVPVLEVPPVFAVPAVPPAVTEAPPAALPLVPVTPPPPAPDVSFPPLPAPSPCGGEPDCTSPIFSAQATTARTKPPASSSERHRGAEDAEATSCDDERGPALLCFKSIPQSGLASAYDFTQYRRRSW